MRDNADHYDMPGALQRFLRLTASEFVNLVIRILRKVLFNASKVQFKLQQRRQASDTAAHLHQTLDQWNRAIVAYYGQLASIPERLPSSPLISILLPVYKVNLRFLDECLASVAAQIYQNWQLCVVDDGSQDEAIEGLLTKFSERFSRKVLLKIDRKNKGICGASQSALDLANGEYVLLLDHDDRLLPNSLLEVVRAICVHEYPDTLYSDECRISEDGAIEGTYHKPAWSPIYALGVHYSTHLTVHRTEIVRRAGGFRLGFEGSQDHDLMLRITELTKKPVVHIPLVLYQWRAHAASTARSRDAKPYAATAGEKAVTEACIRRGWPAQVQFDPLLERYQVKFDLRNPQEIVTIIIPTKDQYRLIQSCLESVFAKTRYPYFEVIVIDHESRSKQCLDLFENYQERYGDRFRVEKYFGAFNFAAMNNKAAEKSRGRYLLFLNNDTEVISENWIEEMLAVAQLPSVGAVGAKLLLENGRIQHAGIVGLGQGVAGNAGFGMTQDTRHYFSYLQVSHEVLAVTAACLLLSKDKYTKVGGFNETDVPSGFGDVDFCLRLRAEGFSSVYVPHAILKHKESISRKAGFEIFEKWYMARKWGHWLAFDPYLNPNLQKTSQYQIHCDALFQQPSEITLKKILRPHLNLR